MGTCCRRGNRGVMPGVSLSRLVVREGTVPLPAPALLLAQYPTGTTLPTYRYRLHYCHCMAPEPTAYLPLPSFLGLAFRFPSKPHCMPSWPQGHVSHPCAVGPQQRPVPDTPSLAPHTQGRQD